MRFFRFQDDQGTVRLGTASSGDWAEEVAETAPGSYENTGRRLRVGRILPPVRPAAIICIGLNYREHAKEAGLEEPEYPVVFMKNPAAAIGHREAIVLPRSCREKPQVDYEAELAVVIGKPAWNIPVDTALDYVKGYTAGNDVSARSWQKHAGGGQWVRGKSFDTFCPLGPVLVTPEEIPDPANLELTCILNGGTMQRGHTSDMIFSVSQLIAYLSEDTTLLPDTVILTGTPSGVGFTRNPPVYLEPRDVVDIRIEKIGTLENPVV